MNRDANPIVIKVSAKERKRIEQRFKNEGQNYTGLSSWARSLLLPPPTTVEDFVKGLDRAGWGFLLDKEHPKIKELLGLGD